MGLYDTRITDGYVGILVSCPEEKANQAEKLMLDSGAEDVRRDG